MRTLRTSVRRLVEFLLRTGDIDSQGGQRGRIDAMLAGGEIHRMLQASGGASYQAEVSLACSVFFPEGSFNPHAARLDIREEAVGDQAGFFLRVEGRADGIIDDGVHPLVIDEIKGVSRDVSAIQRPDAVHEAQALCYAYLYLRQTRGSTALSSAFGEKVVVRVTYAGLDTGEIRQMEHTYAPPDIETRFFSLLEAAQRWAAWRVAHDERRNSTLSSLAFPLVPRDGQRQLMDAVATAIREGRRLYAQAPTGSGKTIATLYPALKAMGAGEVARVSFLTAKTTTRRSALECLDLLRQQDLLANVLVVTARNKICPLRQGASGSEVRVRPLASLCNPVECPLARGHYGSANDALWEAIDGHDVLDRELICKVAARHHVCPYELQRDATRWSDVIICDYHYAFAPSAGLFGLNDDPDGGATVFLVDEAHNLVERMRDMYSAGLAASDLRELERLLRKDGSLDQLATTVRAAIAAFPSWDKALPTDARARAQGSEGRPTYQKVRIGDELEGVLTTLADALDATLEQCLSPTGPTWGPEGQSGAPDGHKIELYLALRDMSHEVRSFLGTLQRAEAGYATFLCQDKGEGNAPVLRIYCVDPSHDLDERLQQAKAAVFFSGTLLPMDYHRKLLAARDDDVTVYVPSGFDPRHRQVLIGSDVSARYSRRGPELYAQIAAYLSALVRARPGNYLVFVPSYAMMKEISEALGPLADERATIVRQRPGMREDERERFVARFRGERAASTSLIGLCVLGGVFGESIDLPGKALVGVVVVGTGMPRATAEREVIRDHFDVRQDKGFAYAYTYPGVIKVLQAAGRLIRTEEDRGVVLLLDDRFLQDELRKAFPREWDDAQECTIRTMPALLARDQD